LARQVGCIVLSAAGAMRSPYVVTTKDGPGEVR
jgi:hypothetical protein